MFFANCPFRHAGDLLDTGPGRGESKPDGQVLALT